MSGVSAAGWLVIQMAITMVTVSLVYAKRYAGYAAFAAASATTAYVLARYVDDSWQPDVLAAWAVGNALWGVYWWRCGTRAPRPAAHAWWLYGLYTVCLLPFATNWRWAMLGDSAQWATGGLVVAQLGHPSHNALSVHGVWSSSYPQMLAHDVFMFVVSPTLFWHRVGQILVGALSLMAIYRFASELVEREAAMAIAVCSMTASVIITYTYSSFPLIDGIAVGYAALALALSLWEMPSTWSAYLFGAITGVAVYTTVNAWPCVALAWLMLIPRRRTLLPLAAVTAVFVAAPVLWQWMSDFTPMQVVADPGATLQRTVEKAVLVAWTAVQLPVSSPVQSAGAFGPQLPWGFRWAAPIGIVTGLILGPRRWRRALLVTLLVFVWYVAALSVTQGTYDALSIKRAFHLIPLATLAAWALLWRLLPSPRWAVPLVAAWVALGVYDVTMKAEPGRFGYNFGDGLIEVHQRFPGEKIAVLLPEAHAWWLQQDSDAQKLYGIRPHLERVASLDAVGATGAQLFCYHAGLDNIDFAAQGWTAVPLYNSVEMRCASIRRPQTATAR